MSFVALNYSNQAPTSLTTNISATTSPLPVTSMTWPLMTPFEIVIDRGNALQEVCLVTAGATSTSLPVTRNYDGTLGPVGTGIGHNTGATVEISATALDWRAFNTHAIDTTRDDHPHLMRSDGTRHNAAARHLMGVSLPGGPPTPSSFGDLQSDGEAASIAYADHVHARTDTYQTYLYYMIRPGMVLPATLAFSNPLFIPCDGRWVNQQDWPILYSQVGNLHQPMVADANSTSPYNPQVHFALPQMGSWNSNFTVFTWLWNIQWVMMAAFPATF